MLELLKLIILIPTNSACCERGIFLITGVIYLNFLIGFSFKNIIKNKFRNCLKTETVDKLIRVALISDDLEIDRATNYFISKKQSTFKDYVNQKIEYHKVKREQKSN